MPTISLTVTTDEVARITEAANAAGYANPKAWAVSLIVGAVHGYERQRDIEAAQRLIAGGYDTAYKPVNPT
jgi:hypothetical protein